MPRLLDDRAISSRAKSDAFSRLLQQLRGELFERLRSSSRSRVAREQILATTDQLIELLLLVDFVRQRDPSGLPSLEEVLSESRRPSIRELSERLASATKDVVLSHMFARYPFSDERRIPKSVLNCRVVSRLAEASRSTFGWAPPVTVFGDFHQRCTDSPLLAGSDIGRRRASSSRQAMGIYYTPPPVVDYLVHRTLRQVSAVKLRSRSARLRILDPSCGCGNFLISAYKYLLTYRSMSIEGTPVCARNIPLLSLQARLDLLRSAIFGIDVDSGAVSWTIRGLLLALWESVVVDGVNTRSTQGICFPSLKHNITCADFLDGNAARTAASRAGCEPCYDVVLGGPPFVRLQRLKQRSPELVARYRESFATAREGNFDLYMPFVEESLRILADTGYLAFSLSSSFLRNESGRVLREFIASNCRVQEIVEFDDAQIYTDASVRIALLSVRKQRKPCRTRYVVMRGRGSLRRNLGRLLAETPGSSRYVSVRSLSARACSGSDWLLEPASDKASCTNLKLVGARLADLSIGVRFGVRTGADDVFLLCPLSHSRGGNRVLMRTQGSGKTIELERSAVRPVVRRGDLDDGSIGAQRCLCVFPYDQQGRLLPERVFRRRFPLAYSYLRRSRLGSAGQHAKSRRAWYAFRTRNIGECLAAPKIVCGRIMSRLQFALDREGLLCHENMLLLLPDPNSIAPFLLLGLLNSNVIQRLLAHRMPRARSGSLTLRLRALHEIPIPMPRCLGEKMLCTKIERLAKQASSRKTSTEDRRRIQRQIDELVRELLESLLLAHDTAA
ncbi:MAG: N-6 DNA methylase [Phycisphaerae bacterium]|nr:N-6 DNA methylase [Phycisphaerae bacterium]